MKFNKKDLNLSAWIVVIMAYFLPYQSKEGFATEFGYPISFLTTYDKPVNNTLLMSNALNIGGFLVDILIVYWVIRLMKFIQSKYFNKVK